MIFQFAVYLKGNKTIYTSYQGKEEYNKILEWLRDNVAKDNYQVELGQFGLATQYLKRIRLQKEEDFNLFRLSIDAVVRLEKIISDDIENIRREKYETWIE